MDRSKFIEQAAELLQQACQRTSSIHERAEQAISLAALILEESRARQTAEEREQQAQLAAMLKDPDGKVFVTQMTDQCFRSQTPSRTADQLISLLNRFGTPKYLSYLQRLQLSSFRFFGKWCPWLVVPMVKAIIRRQTARVIIPGEPDRLQAHLQERTRAGVRVNLNHLGEAILGEEEAEARLQVYLSDLAKPEVEVISVKTSSIFSQINHLSWNQTVQILSEQLARLYRVAAENDFVRPDGSLSPKFVNLDMEEFSDLTLTVTVFKRVLDLPEFHHLAAGIVLQAYLPDSHRIQRELTEWAVSRVAEGKATIKIRLVKGANLAMEQVTASLHGWPQAPYTDKAKVDANFKRMVLYGLEPLHAKAVHIGIGSHNLFDIAFALLLRAEKGLEAEVEFEMLEGMADPLRRVVQELAGAVLLYCPSATEDEFQNAVAYLIRRLDENTAPQNFLRHSFDLIPGSADWREQAELFRNACKQCHLVSAEPHRTQDLAREPAPICCDEPFQNEPEADWSLAANRIWIEGLLPTWQRQKPEEVPLMIAGGKLIDGARVNESRDPSDPNILRYTYVSADIGQVDQALACAKRSEDSWKETSVHQRAKLLHEMAHQLRVQRGALIAAMMFTCGKTAAEADLEVVEAIDFAGYYRHNILEWTSLNDIAWKPKGTVVVAPPWNFPCSIPFGGIAAALVAGNCVILKPAPEAVYLGWQLANLCWKAGVPKEVLQFLPCEDEPAGSALIQDKRVDAVLLTGATATAQHLIDLRPNLDLMAETGGKNAIIVTAMCDRDLAIRDVIRSAFGHAGQKCSACSLLICEAEIYDNEHFRHHLRDAAASLQVGPAWDLRTVMNPLIRPPSPELLRALTELEEGEEWLLEPHQLGDNPNLWSPGIKFGVKAGSFMHQTELFGPVLAVMRARDLKEAVSLANGTPYGLTSGLHSLDEREQIYWSQHVIAGNCYINRGITGAIVQRQPFGGCKDSCFGSTAKAGGPNYLTQLMIPSQKALPLQRDLPTNALNPLFQRQNPSDDEMHLWHASLSSYAFFWNHYFSRKHDASQLIGQDNFLFYLPQPLILRVQTSDTPLDILRVCAAAVTCGAPLEISAPDTMLQKVLIKRLIPASIHQVSETNEELVARLSSNAFPRVRFLTTPDEELRRCLLHQGTRIVEASVLANGRLELLHYLREVSLSVDYHRYGNRGAREKEQRAPLKEPNFKEVSCRGCRTS